MNLVGAPVSDWSVDRLRDYKQQLLLDDGDGFMLEKHTEHVIYIDWPVSWQASALQQNWLFVAKLLPRFLTVHIWHIWTSFILIVDTTWCFVLQYTMLNLWKTPISLICKASVVWHFVSLCFFKCAFFFFSGGRFFVIKLFLLFNLSHEGFEES